MFGGGMRQVGIIAAGALYALDHNLERISDDHRRAAALANNLKACGLFGINTETIQTNIVVITLKPPLEVDSFCAALARNGLLIVPFGAHRIRAVAHLDVDDGDIREASRIMLETADSV
jgi:threonine aldolase